MAAFTVQPKPFNFVIVCAVLIVLLPALATLAAGLRPDQATEVAVPAPQAVPAAPAAAVGPRLQAPASAVAAGPQPVPAPTAPAAWAAEAGHRAGSPAAAAMQPAAGNPLPLLALAVAGVLLVAGTIARRRTGPVLQPAA
jgi:hypothetical protein